MRSNTKRRAPRRATSSKVAVSAAGTLQDVRVTANKDGSYTVAVPALQPIRTAFIRRSVLAIVRIARNATERQLEDALAAPTDVGTVAQAVSDAGIADVERVDPLASLLAKGAKDKDYLAKAAGGLLPVGEVARILGITRQAVHKRVREKKLLAIRQGTGVKYPAVQFVDEDVVPGLKEVLRSIGLEGPWSILDFLLAPEDELEGLSPIEALKTRADLREAVIDLARAEGRHGAAPV